MSEYVVRQCEPPNQDKWCIGGVLGRTFDSEPAARAEAERLQQSWDSMLEWIEKQHETLQEINARNGEYCGLVKCADEYHIVLSAGRGASGVHQIQALSQTVCGEQSLYIKYRNGRGNVESKGVDQNRGVGARGR